MNETLIENYNNVVKRNDIVYHLGDFCFAGFKEAESIFNRLNGQKILIEGNHDSDSCFKLKWAWIKNYYELKTEKANFVLFHYPIQSWNGFHRGAVHLHGHSHCNIKNKNIRRIDVGVDNPLCDYRPFSIDEIIKINSDIKIENYDEKN
jgi:calcineurin-like phosphoesterase family protein